MRRKREVLSCISSISKAFKIEGSSRSIQTLDGNDVCLLTDWLVVVTAMKLHPVSNEIMTGDNDHEKWYEMRVKRLAFSFFDASLCLLFFLPFNFIAFLLMFLPKEILRISLSSEESTVVIIQDLSLSLSPWLFSSRLLHSLSTCLGKEASRVSSHSLSLSRDEKRREKRGEKRREKFFIAASRDGPVPLFLASKHEFQVDQSNKDADLSLLSSCHLMLQFVWQFGGFFSFFDLLSDGIWFQSSL